MITTVALYIVLVVISVFLEQKFRILIRLKYYLAYTYVWILKRRTPPIFDFQFKSKDLKKFGITSLPEAWFRERPRALQPNIHASDTHVFYGVHKDGSVLVARITRRHNRIADTWVYLRLPSGDQYELPNHPDTKIYNVCDNKFSAGGLTFELLEPLRRWRVIFNGYLRKNRSWTEWDDSDNDTVHVSFNFIWRPMYNYVAFPQDFNCSFLAEIMCSRPWRKGLINPNEIFSEETFNIPGHMIGEVNIDNRKEIVLQLRGIKQRKHGVHDWNEIDSKLIIQGTLDNGLAFYIIAENNNVTRLSYLYGYLSPPSNYVVHHVNKFSVEPEELLSEKCPNKLSFQFCSGKKNFILNVTCDEDGFIVREGNHWAKEISIHPIKVTLNNKEGRGIIKHVASYHGHCTAPVQQSLPLLREPVISETDALAVSFMDIECRSSKIVGGKGASLANMLSIPNNMFRVPLGVCLTKTAFEIHLHDNPSIMEAILRMQNVAWQRSHGTLPDECDRVITTMNNVATIPENVKNQLQLKLISVFGEDFAKMKFAVRSSAIGEDGDEMSAAGQNETFLGIIGFNDICNNILKCWASQFAYRSVEYKRQNGQLINSGMGVVVQAMIPADVSGVLFSRDPLTGSRTSMLISSNFGLGESVVSASADPDSITLRRSWNDKLSVLKKELGSKKHMIIMAEEGGTVESEVDKDKASTLTISDKLAIKLGQIAIFQEQCFGNPRDIEWAIQGNKIFLLQSRPVTVDNIVPDLEILHEFDTAPKTDNERGSTANVGEVIPGALSPLGFSSTVRTMACQSMDLLTWKLKTHRFDPIVFDGWMFHYGHCFFDLIHQKTWSLGKKGTIDKATDIGLFGRVLDDDDVLELAMERFEDPPLKSKLTLARFAFKGLLFGSWLLKNLLKSFESCPDPTTGIKSIKDAYETLGNHLFQQFTAFDSHMSISIGSSLWNVLVLNLLSNDSQDYTLDQYTDFAKVIGSGIGAESGNVPYSLQKLAKQIAKEIDPEKFISWSSEHALQWIQESSKNSCLEFKKFLDRHGHRGVKEVDVMAITWALNPIGVVKILQDILRLPEKNFDLNKDVDELSGLKTHLTPFRRFLLKLVMKGSRLGVCQREKAKSMLINYIHSMRLGYRHLAALMVSEGYIPDPNLLFFFTHEEIEQLLNTRSANLLRRVKHRSRLYSKMDGMKFPEMTIGFPVPIGNEDDEIVDEITDSVTGYPVSQGVVKGPAKVVKTFHDIGTIQPGDILITTATDIGWSPYFPMLSGVVTEIGGLISHGAVVAREFGLPCIVGAQRATKIFKTGDTVILDATEGVLSKVHSAASQLFRHGDRTPIKPFPKDAYVHYWKEGYGQLTDVGKKQHYALGQYFRSRYKSFLNETYNMDEILANSTDTDRTLMSATVHLAGLYPPVGDQIWNKKLRWQPVPVHTKQKEEDYILDTDSYCPKYSRLSDEVLKSPEMLKINEENSGLYKLVTNETGTLVTNIFSINEIHDTLFIEKNNNLTVPTWVDDVFSQMRNLSNLSFSWRYITHEERRLKGGPLIGHLITNMNLKINRTNEKRKLYLYSSHDTSVAALLSSLSIFNGIAPPYACAVIVELHSLSDRGYGVQILYKNSSENDPIILTLPNCTAMCPFDQFVALTSSTVPQDIISECEVPKSVWTQFPWTITSVVLSLTLLFLLSLVCGIFCWKKRYNINYRYMMVQNE